MLLMICGHPRSGTTLMQQLCDTHPQMAVTNEFGNLAFLGQTYGEYARNVYDRWRRVQGKWAFDIAYAGSSERMRLNNLWFALRHLYYFRRHYQGAVTAVSLEAAHRQMFPQATVVGDKWPHYLFRLDQYVKNEALSCLVIYRDCRDVTSSFLHQARTNWKNTDWVHRVDNAEKIATRWVKGIEIMEAQANKIIMLQYEALMRQPVEELARVSQAIGVDPAGFPAEIIDDSSIGKFARGLTSAEIDTVWQIAGPTMERLGYLS